MAQGEKEIFPSDSGGSAISELEGIGVLFAVGSQASISAKDFLFARPSFLAQSCGNLLGSVEVRGIRN